MINRRELLKGAAIYLAATKLNAREETRLQGIFPIVQTPFTSDNRLDTKTLAAELQFLHESGVQGVVWPQLASEWAELSPEERTLGAETVVKTMKGLKPKVVLGVQGPDIESAVRYAQHAEKLGPDAIIALPPRDTSNLDRVTEYYLSIAKQSTRLLIVQSIGNMSVEFVLSLGKQIPTLRYVKDEAGHTLTRISQYHKLDPEFGVFTGAHGKTIMDELKRGAVGSMPAACFGDLYAKFWGLWQEGRREEAMDHFSRIALLIHQIEAYGLPSLKYVLFLRGIFKNWSCRGKNDAGHFDEAAQAQLKETYNWVL